MQPGDLTTLKTCEAYIPNFVSDSGGPNDTLIARLITAASIFISNYLDRDQASLGGQGYNVIAAVSSDAGGQYVGLAYPLAQVPPAGSAFIDLTQGLETQVVTPAVGFSNAATKLYVASNAGMVAADDAQAVFLTQYNDIYNGRGTERFPLRQWPIVNVSAVTVWGVTQPQSTAPNVPGYQNDDRFLYMLWGCFTRGPRNIQVSYAAGYPTVPDDLEQACIDLVGKKFRQRDHIEQTAIGVMADRISYSQKNMDANTALVLQRYERELAAWS